VNALHVLQVPAKYGGTSLSVGKISNNRPTGNLAG